MKFFDKVGPLGIGSRLRILGERLTDESQSIYKMYNIDFQPKWIPVYYTLMNSDKVNITDLANEIGHSHASVSKIVREMVKKGILTEEKYEQDKRVNLISLSQKGLALAAEVKEPYIDV